MPQGVKKDEMPGSVFQILCRKSSSPGIIFFLVNESVMICSRQPVNIQEVKAQVDFSSHLFCQKSMEMPVFNLMVQVRKMAFQSNPKEILKVAFRDLISGK